MKYKKLVIKSFIFLLCLSLAWFLVKSEYIHYLLRAISPLMFVSELLAGAFYTSFLTSPLSVGILIVLADEGNPIIIALLAGLGAAIVDLFLVLVFRQHFTKDVLMLKHEPIVKIINRVLRKYHLGFTIPLLGVLVIASPLPDELGLILLGAQEMQNKEILVLTYLFNTIGILLIVLPVSFFS